MSTRAVFVTSKQPFGRSEDGEVILSRRLISALSKVCSVRVVALAETKAAFEPPVELIEIPKPPVSLGWLMRESLVRRRSLIHTRFAPQPLVATLRRLPADVFIARRVYMAQALVDAGRTGPADRMGIVVDALESTVLDRRGGVFRLEAVRTRRDELTCLRAASMLAVVSDAELADLSCRIAGATRLDVALAPAATAAPLREPLAVFVGDRTWPPNADALRRLLTMWPQIHTRVPKARLLVVGRPGRREPPSRDPSVEIAGFVDDIDAMWQQAGVLLAPVQIGGGVRVKILDAARHGVPLVATSAAIGSTRHFLPLTPLAVGAPFVEAAAELLGDRTRRQLAGAALYDANRAHIAAGVLERQLEPLVAGRPSADAEA